MGLIPERLALLKKLTINSMQLMKIRCKMQMLRRIGQRESKEYKMLEFHLLRVKLMRTKELELS